MFRVLLYLVQIYVRTEGYEKGTWVTDERSKLRFETPFPPMPTHLP